MLEGLDGATALVSRRLGLVVPGVLLERANKEMVKHNEEVGWAYFLSLSFISLG